MPITPPKPLAEWRAERGFTQMELAVKAGLSLSTVVNVETSRQDVSINTARKLVAALDITLNDVAWPEIDSIRRRRPKHLREDERPLQHP